MKILLFIVLICSNSLLFAEYVINEGFEGGVLPSGWQVWEEGDPSSENWDVINYFAHTGIYALQHGDGDYGYTNDDWVVTETFDLSNFVELGYSFWYRCGVPDLYDYTGFYISTMNNPSPDDFVELLELGDTGGSGIYSEFSGDISPYAGEQYVTFAWRYEGSWSHFAYIDDIKIWGYLIGLESLSWGSIKAILQ